MIEKKEDIGKLQSMGADNKFTNRIFLFEGWMISLFGAIIGVVVGVGLCLLQKYFGLIKLGQTAGAFIIDAYPVEIEIFDIAIIFLTVIFIGFLAALYPVHFLGNKLLDKRVLSLILIPLMTISCVGMKKEADSKAEIAVTIEPQRYFADKIAGDNFSFFSVVPAGQGAETYDPTPQEMTRIGKSKAYFKLGQLSIEETITEAMHKNNANLQIFDTSHGMNIISGSNKAETQIHNSHSGSDPHVWTSISGAEIISQNILNALIILDKERKNVYESNYNTLSEEISDLEKNLHEQLDSVSNRCFVIYHPALTYFAEEFGFKQLSIEDGGKEPSPASLERLIKEAKRENAKIVFVQKEYSSKYAKQIAEEIGAKIVEIDLLDYDWEKIIKEIANTLANNGETD
jgi:zinc transport system substrate-binding protein